jgi:hypothetical protein
MKLVRSTTPPAYIKKTKPLLAKINSSLCSSSLSIDFLSLVLSVKRSRISSQVTTLRRERKRERERE